VGESFWKNTISNTAFEMVLETVRKQHWKTASKMASEKGIQKKHQKTAS
jgi:ABC-type taurine transport system ATPase subunit